MARIQIKSEVTGRVWKIESAVGDMLAADDTIMLIESMKMEIPVPAPSACRLVEILFQEDEPVKEGEVLAIVER
jgi:acetyl-CoA carboxylase biotin carboxyl carrier protein